MKMKDLDEQVSLEAEPDFGKFNQDDIMRSIAKKKDSADDDEAGLSKGFDQVATQARHLSYAFGTDGGDIKTIDGKTIPVTQDEAKYLSKFAGNAVSDLYPLFGITPTFPRDLEARDMATKIFSSSDGVMKVLDKFRK
jgi:hypothetical protein